MFVGPACVCLTIQSRWLRWAPLTEDEGDEAGQDEDRVELHHRPEEEDWRAAAGDRGGSGGGNPHGSERGDATAKAGWGRICRQPQNLREHP
jgi:hypothetical protein